MKLDELEFSGEKLPVYYGISAVEEIMKGLSPEDLGKNLVSNMKKALFVGLEHGHRKKGIKFKISMNDLVDMIDENPESFRKAWSLYNEKAAAFFAITEDQEKKS